MGKTSPEGFFFDSYNYPLLKTLLLEPLSPQGKGIYKTAAFDHRLDSPVIQDEKKGQANSILVFDGIFLHRPELRQYWDFSIFLEVSFTTSYARMAKRDGSSPNPQVPENHRYLEGQKIYLNTCQPREKASVVIDYNDHENPFILT